MQSSFLLLLQSCLLITLLIYLLSFVSTLWILNSFLASVVINYNEGVLRNRKNHVLTVMSVGHALHVLTNNQLVGDVGSSQNLFFVKKQM